MIRELRASDLPRVMEIWLQGNREGHPFVPAAYWEAHFAQVREMIAQSEVYVHESAGEIQGFLGLVDGYVAGLFVDGACRSRGVGRELLRRGKQRYAALALRVYQKNERAVAFYLREGFTINGEERDADTGEAEYCMVWRGEQR